ncbi:hypothetical protein AB0P21_21940 [Kribbella sp. NPDC056861]|uniref:hypothetical protein n=1 Tax=Kribbella sp. NPDC056861 TaxID=3154857 RepID=UPI00341FDBF2
MSTADAWSAELESSGQVVFPQRRKRLWIRAAIGAVLLGNSLWSLIAHIRDDEMDGLFGVLRVTSLAAFAFIVAMTAWQLITRRPMVTVDQAGIRVGKNGKHGYAWHQIARIDDPSGPPGGRTIQIQPIDRHRLSPFGISQDNVLELADLATWLRTLHTNQPRPTDA